MAAAAFTITVVDKAVRARAVSGASPAISRARGLFGGMSTAFKALTPGQKAGWQAVANDFSRRQGRTARGWMTAANAFKMLAMGRVALGMAYSADAPPVGALGVPPPMPRVALTALSVDGEFSLSLASLGGVFECGVLVLAAPPQVAGRTSWRDRLFSPIGALPGVAPEGTEIGALYAAKFGVPEAGYEIVLRLMPITEAGVRGEAAAVAGVCGDGPRECEEGVHKPHTQAAFLPCLAHTHRRRHETLASRCRAARPLRRVLQRTDRPP